MREYLRAILFSVLCPVRLVSSGLCVCSRSMPSAVFFCAPFSLTPTKAGLGWRVIGRATGSKPSHL
eukprot:10598480-Alexandrium_andersonii.AAC.1